MFGDTSDLAENKLLLLYIFDKIKLPISTNQITQIILENSFINYFTLHQYISELLAAGFLNYTATDIKHRLIITDRGSKVLSMFQKRLPKNKVEVLDTYLNTHLDNIKKEITVSADYTIENKNNYIVNLITSENNNALIDLKINVSTNKQAQELCNKWKNSSTELYEKILKLLLD
jgi:predicted transcriptional regulator